MENIKIVLASGSLGADSLDAEIDKALRAIAVHYEVNDEWAEKYGTNFENEKFTMHRFCWCEQDDCQYCNGDELPNFHYKPLDLKVWWYKYIGRGTVVNKEITLDEIINMVKDLCS